MTTHHRFPIVLLAALAVGACANDEMPEGDGDADDTGGNEGIFTITNADDDDDDDSLDDSSSGGSGDASSTGDEPQQLNCDKLDFVFVIDNSSSMADEQLFLADAVPGFVEAMGTQFPNIQSYRVGVVDTDSYPAVGSAEAPLEGCPEGAECTSCDYQLGAFLAKPNSAVDPAVSCAFTTDTAFMDGESTAFSDEFACAAIVGTQGNPIEQQVGALVSAVGPDMNAEGACNEGFVRDDALLVFLLITDEEDDHKDMPAPQGGSLGEPGEWHASIVAAKDGKEANIVALGLIGGSPRFPDCTALSQDGNGAEQSSRLDSFLGMFQSNFVGSVCTEGYDGFFAAALDKVEEACVNFIP